MVVLATAGAAPALAQAGAGPQRQPTTLKPHSNWTVKGHLSLQLSTGLDLDAFGNITDVGVGQRGTQPLVINLTGYPDTYVTTPHRERIAIGLGFARRAEVFVQASRTTYTGTPVGVGVENANMTMDISPYKEVAFDVGLRKYFNTGESRRIYVALSGGQRKIDAISAVFDPEVGASLGRLRLYDASKVKSFGVEFGITLEGKHVGLFFDGGARWQGKLKQLDDDLLVFGLEKGNDTGARFYMPVQLGLLIRM